MENLERRLKAVPVFDDATGVGQPMAYALASPPASHLFYLSAAEITKLNTDCPIVVDAGYDPIASYTPVKPADNE